MRPQAEAGRLAARLPPLLVAAERIAATIAGGAHGRRRSGPGETFWQYRRAQPGDPAAAVDWRQSARSQALFIRETEWAAAQTVWLSCDGSASMRWRSSDRLPEKGERALVISLALALLLVRGGERVAPLAGGMAPCQTPGAVGLLAQRIEQTDDFATTTASLPRGAEIVLVSDFLEAPEILAGRLRCLAGHGICGHLLQVLDPAEESLPYQGRIRFQDPEGDGSILVRRAEGVVAAYGAALRAHRASLADAAASLGWSFATHHTDQPPQTALLALIQRIGQPHGPAGPC